MTASMMTSAPGRVDVDATPMRFRMSSWWAGTGPISSPGRVVTTTTSTPALAR